MEDFLTIVIPVFLVVEKDFVNIMAAEFLDQPKQLSLENQLVNISSPADRLQSL